MIGIHNLNIQLKLEHEIQTFNKTTIFAELNLQLWKWSAIPHPTCGNLSDLYKQTNSKFVLLKYQMEITFVKYQIKKPI